MKYKYTLCNRQRDNVSMTELNNKLMNASISIRFFTLWNVYLFEDNKQLVELSAALIIQIETNWRGTYGKFIGRQSKREREC